MRFVTDHDDVRSLPIGMSRSLLAIATVSISLGIIFWTSGPERLSAPGFRPAQSLGIPVLSVGFILIGVALIVAWKTGRGLVIALRLHSLYFGFWAAMFAFAWVYYAAAATPIPVYLGMSAWSTLCVATVKQWRRLKGPL